MVTEIVHVAKRSSHWNIVCYFILHQILGMNSSASSPMTSYSFSGLPSRILPSLTWSYQELDVGPSA